MLEQLQQYGPTLPTGSLVTELNRLYHEFEADNYESNHPEIFVQLPPLWHEMCAQAARLLGNRDQKLRILDFGCGTGFEARRCLADFCADQVERLVCYDPSKEMLHRCREGLKDWPYRVEFISDLGELGDKAGGFNVLLTNSVLHHMMEPVQAIQGLTRLLSASAVWLCGHEPSRRFWANPECRELLRSYRSAQQLRRWVSPQRYARKLARWAGVSELPEDYAARRAFEESIFERKPPARLVSSLVDYHVISSERQLGEQKGLDFANLQTGFAADWELVWRSTYSFLGPHYEGHAPEVWKRNARMLAERFPDDGANCCLVWRRV